ncbi:MAG: glutamate 5-kinase [Magnetococcales bacterium]|nr:glutamate 5-kinase [Magnetococcales bacterium]
MNLSHAPIDAQEFSLAARIEEQWRLARTARRLVVKIGSNLLTGGGQGVRGRWLDDCCGEIAGLMDVGKQVVVVTSGAVAAGTPRLGLGRRPNCLREKQAAAAAGQGVLMRWYEESLESRGRHPAQVLLTREDVQHRRGYLNARDTLVTLLELGLVPVINENDTVAVEELKFGDNDTLAALVAGLIDAELLILLTDVDGLFNADPRHHAGASVLPLVEHVTPEVEALAGGVGSAVGSGGMRTKLKAARKAARYGCRTILADGFADHPLRRVMDPALPPAGTLFMAEPGDPISHRKRWIANGLVSEGTLLLDEGAALALRAGKSLLSKGVRGVEGAFERGAVVYCRAPDGRAVAKGMVNFAASQALRIMGRHSHEIESLLGFASDEEMIHRDNLVLL